ncbi:hypothetical protein Sru01_11370 [Sphaerisporangium rufum]|uniref:Aminoglycoside phosphotransferase domain-containing protein n=1 Tax=Sphaerisporangium rufum TaxID=1381558 RepID=A0A919V3C3_9ACTN|nr:phosphotransferase [Sphaerisporangium rufum]GII76155.1 hypothetical protein Sru01_11370 [Sphaerisporangium rufum]
MQDLIHVSLRRHLPGREIGTPTLLGEGSDHLAYEIDGEIIVRVSKSADPGERQEAVRREAGLLALVARLSTLPVPEPVFADEEAGVLAYAKLPGVPLNEHPVAEPGRLAEPLGRFAGRLHDAPLDQVEHLVPRDVYPPPAWLADAERDYRAVAGHLPPDGRRRVEAFLGRTPPPEPKAVAFCHNDLGAEHLLVDPASGALTGVIDWSDAAITDPVRDLALIYRDLGPEVFDRALDHYGRRCDAADRERAAFYARCSLLEDIAYGVETGARRYADNGLANLDRTFSG